MAALWSDNSSVRKWVISKPCEVFIKKYDDVQDLLQKLSCMDDFLSGKSSTFISTFTCISIYMYKRYNIQLLISLTSQTKILSIRVFNWTKQ